MYGRQSLSRLGRVRTPPPPAPTAPRCTNSSCNGGAVKSKCPMPGCIESTGKAKKECRMCSGKGTSGFSICSTCKGKGRLELNETEEERERREEDWRIQWREREDARIQKLEEEEAERRRVEDEEMERWRAEQAANKTPEEDNGNPFGYNW